MKYFPVTNMKRLLLISIMALAACNTKKTDEKKVPPSEIGTVISSDTTTILGSKYMAYGTDQNRLIVLNMKGDTVLNQGGLYFEFEFSDFNRDSLNDILIRPHGNVASHSLLLFNKEEMNFMPVRGFEKLPDAKPISGTPYYYSYHATGCADNLWESDLFYIENFETHRIANISGNECEGDKSMIVSQVTDEEIRTLDKLTLDILPFYENRKWGFIAEYWTKNYFRFAEQKAQSVE